MYTHSQAIYISLTPSPLEYSLCVRMATYATMTVCRARRDEEGPAVLLSAGSGEFLEVEHFAERHTCSGLGTLGRCSSQALMGLDGSDLGRERKAEA